MLKKIKNLINAIMMCVTFIMIIYFITNGMYNRLYACIMLYFLIFLPNIFDKTSYKLNSKIKLIYTIYIFLAQFLGSIINLYKIIWWYDLLVHFLSGFLLIILGLTIIKNTFRNKLNRFIYYIGFVSFVTIIWEVFEFVFDILLKANMQHMETGVFDTMEDMIAALIGGILGYILLVKER